MTPLSKPDGSSKRTSPDVLPSQTHRSRRSAKTEHRFLPFSMPDLDDDELAELTETLRSGWLSSGAKVRQFEQEFAKFVGVKHAIAVNNGTTAFRLTVQSLGLCPGDEVIMSPFAPVVAAELVRSAGATPCFVDVIDHGLHLSPKLLPAAITERTRAVLISHVAGLPADMDELLAIARQHRLTVIEDAGQALLATYRHDMVGGLGDTTCFTFFAQKAIALGEGGMICTHDSLLAEQFRMMVVSPWSLVAPNLDVAFTSRTEFAEVAELPATFDRPLNEASGTAARQVRRSAAAAKRSSFHETQLLAQAIDGYQASMNELTASLGVAQLRRVTAMWQRRREIALTYNVAFSRNIELEGPVDRADSQHAWHLYLLRLNLLRLRITRDEFLAELHARKIGASVMPLPLHLQPLYAELFGYQPESCPVATQEYSREISLPIYNRMTDADVQRVIDAVEAIVKRYRFHSESDPRF